MIEFHKRLMRGALVRPSDGSPRAEERVAALLRGRRRSRRSCGDWLADQAEPQVVVKDPHAAWVLPTLAPGRRRRPAATCGCSPRCGTRPRWSARRTCTWGEGRRTDAERRVKETSNTAAWLNVALVTEAGSPGRAAGVPALRRPARRLAHARSAGSPTSSTSRCRSTRTAASTTFLDPGMRRSQLTWADLVLPDWLRDLAEDTWQQLGALVARPRGPRGPRPGSRPPAASYAAHYAEAVAVSPRRGPAPRAPRHRGRARPSSGAGCKAERARRKAGRGQARPEPGQGQSTKRAARPDPAAGRGRGTATPRTRRSAGSARPPHAPVASGSSAERGDTLNRASRSGSRWSMPRSSTAAAISGPAVPGRTAPRRRRSAPARRTPRRDGPPWPRSGSARRTTARRTAARPAPRRCPGLCAGRRRFCIRTCDQIRSTGSRRRNAATARTPALLERRPDPGQPLRPTGGRSRA